MNIITNIFSENLLGITLTLTFLLSIAYHIYAFSKDTVLFLFYIILQLYVIIASKYVDLYARKFCLFLNDHLFVGHKNEGLFRKNPKKINKFASQAWQLFLHVSSLLFETNTIMKTKWWKDPKTCWSPCPCDQVANSQLKLMYAFESAAYIYDGVAHRFWNPRKNDYYVMFFHHIVTVLLISGSYNPGYFPIGAVVMFLHDISDIAVDMLVIVNQAKLEGQEWFFIVEIQYVVTTLNWFFFRNILFYKKILKPVYNVIYYTDCFDNKMSHYYIFLGLLAALYIMHFYWLYVFLRIGYDILTMEKGKDRGVSYETKET